jgi:ribosomal protein S18 acetylase RimI-like enzyme
MELAALRMEAVRAVEGNPWEVEIRRIGGAVAVRSASALPMSNVVGLADDSILPDLDSAIEAAGGSVAATRFDIVPVLPSLRLMRALSRRGYAHSDFRSAMCGRPDRRAAAREFSGRVRLISDEGGDLSSWVEAYMTGFRTPPALRAFSSASFPAGHSRSGLELLAAELDGRLAAVALVWFWQEVGYLSVGTTLPEFRGRGCQQALIAERLRMAAQRGCDLVACHTVVNSQSQRNMERFGLRLAFHKAVWSRPAA